jgi:predicted TIM-barrel fold metal-dependent hydrolase
VKYKVIDVGTHANPPAEMWVERFPAELRDLAPRKEMRSNHLGEYEVLVCEGKEIRHQGSTLGVPYDEHYGDGPFARMFSDGVKGGYDPHARIADMDKYGIDAQVIVRGLHGGGAFGAPDLAPMNRQTWWGCIRAYNDWITDFCAIAPDRLLPVGELPTWDMELMLKEARTIKDRGMCAVQLPIAPGKPTEWSTPADHDYADPWWEPLWTELENLGLPVVAHVDSTTATPSLTGPPYRLEAPRGLINVWSNKTSATEMVASLFLSGVLDRHRKLRFVFNETGIGWAAHFVPWMDTHMELNPELYKKFGFKRKPSEAWREHFLASTLWDSCGIKNRDLIGIETFAWCSDYPETYGTFARAKAQQDRDLAGCNADERYAVLAGNAVRVFGLS